MRNLFTSGTNVHVLFPFTHCLVLSKPVTYAIALNELGNETVHKYVGTEPSGRMFNAIVLDYNGEFCRVSWVCTLFLCSVLQALLKMPS